MLKYWLQLQWPKKKKMTIKGVLDPFFFIIILHPNKEIFYVHSLSIALTGLFLLNKGDCAYNNNGYNN